MTNSNNDFPLSDEFYLNLGKSFADVVQRAVREAIRHSAPEIAYTASKTDADKHAAFAFAKNSGIMSCFSTLEQYAIPVGQTVTIIDQAKTGQTLDVRNTRIVGLVVDPSGGVAQPTVIMGITVRPTRRSMDKRMVTYVVQTVGNRDNYFADVTLNGIDGSVSIHLYSKPWVLAVLVTPVVCAGFTRESGLYTPKELVKVQSPIEALHFNAGMGRNYRAAWAKNSAHAYETTFGTLELNRDDMVCWTGSGAFTTPVMKQSDFIDACATQRVASVRDAENDTIVYTVGEKSLYVARNEPDLLGHFVKQLTVQDTLIPFPLAERVFLHPQGIIRLNLCGIQKRESQWTLTWYNEGTPHRQRCFSTLR